MQIFSTSKPILNPTFIQVPSTSPENRGISCRIHDRNTSKKQNVATSSNNFSQNKDRFLLLFQYFFTNPRIPANVMSILGNYSTVQNARDSIGWILLRWQNTIYLQLDRKKIDMTLFEVHDFPTSFIEVFLCRFTHQRLAKLSENRLLKGHVILNVEWTQKSAQVLVVVLGFFRWLYYHSSFFLKWKIPTATADELKFRISAINSMYSLRSI